MSAWIKIPSSWPEEDDVEDLGSDLAMFHISALAYSGRSLTDGQIPAKALRKLWPIDDPKAAADALVEAGLWTANDAGYEINDWRVHLLTADEINAKREQSRISTERHRRHKGGDHSMCDRCEWVRVNGPWTERDQSRDSSGDTARDQSRDRSVTPLGSGRNGSGRNGVETRGETRPRPSPGTRSAGAPHSPYAGPPPGHIPTVTVQAGGTTP